VTTRIVRIVCASAFARVQALYYSGHTLLLVLSQKNKREREREKTNLPAMFHVERLVHAASDLDAQVFVNGVFRNFHFVPLGKLLFIASGKSRNIKK